MFKNSFKLLKINFAKKNIINVWLKNQNRSFSHEDTKTSL